MAQPPRGVGVGSQKFSALQALRPTQGCPFLVHRQHQHASFRKIADWCFMPPSALVQGREVVRCPHEVAPPFVTDRSCLAQ